MQWLLHGPLTPAVADALRRHEHSTHTIEELSLGAQPAPADLFKAASARQWDILTCDPTLNDALFNERIPFDRSVVFLQLSGGDVEQDDAIDRLFGRYKRLSLRRLYTITASRVKIRQLPGG